MSRKQLDLDFNRGRKLWILHQVSPLMPFSRMARVLRAIDDVARNESKVSLTHREISAYDGMSVPTVRRGIEDLCRYGLLIKDSTINARGQQANSYRIVWPNLDAIANGEPLDDPAPVPEKSTQVLKAGGDHHEHPPDHSDYPPAHHDQAPPDHSDQALLYPPLKPINTPPPSHQALVTSAPAWSVVEEVLISEGVGRASPAVESARSRGCVPAEILQLIEFARSKPGAYGPGAIYTRIRNALPGEDPAAGWPPEDEKYHKNQRQAQADRECRRSAQETADRRAKRKVNQRARQELEREYGPQLDRLKRDELLDFVRVHCEPVIVRALAQNPDIHRSAGFYRVTLLEALRDQATGLPGEV
ncbi:hypothetical protein [Gimesia aquarii]|uniref:Helix-turn-helix domain-containing protein n=1 Tax=Gimesia aquarii TaxID=2527964 RepID=A0A517VPA9_9PLAN|nr:hypothetical protein [Gimesia aquarii]QDT94803.1 hypothetical protein V144x_02350 [Gimesia aquarii]